MHGVLICAFIDWRKAARWNRAVKFRWEKEAEKIEASKRDQNSIRIHSLMDWNRNLIRHQVCLKVHDNCQIVI